VSIIAALDQIIEDLSDEHGAQTTSAIFNFDHRASDDEAAADAFVTHDSEDIVAEAVTRVLNMNYMVLKGFAVPSWTDPIPPTGITARAKQPATVRIRDYC
jgi:hypothetical protein